MNLKPRKQYLEIPNYSLTGDLIAFHRCGVQYRYQNRGRLPPSTPVQLWFGEFIHGVMEEAYLAWSREPEDSPYKTFPWNYETSHKLQVMVDRTRLAPQNILAPRNQFTYDVARPPKPANMRAFEAVNLWGPHLFPLIERAEVPLHGLRDMPPAVQNPRATRYEISGIVDVLAGERIQRAGLGNRLLQAVREKVQLPDDRPYEIIVDYKGSYSLEPGHPYRQLYQWQLETYAWLRQQQEDASPIRAGVLLFLNELYPTKDKVEELAQLAGLHKPIPGASDEDLRELRNYRPGRRLPRLSKEFRMQRSLLVVPLGQDQAQSGAGRFDRTIAAIENAVAQETTGTPLVRAWSEAWRNLSVIHGTPQTAPDEGTCIACDHRTYCPIAIEAHAATGIATVPDPET